MNSIQFVIKFYVVIVGGGIVGWMMVVVLVRKFGLLVCIIFVELLDILMIGVGEVIILLLWVFY